MDFNTDRLPFQLGSHDTLRLGVNNSHKHEQTFAHPVERIQQQGPLENRQQKLEQMRNVYGGAAAARMTIEEQILSRPSRLPGGIASSRLGYASMTGRLDDFGVEDYLGRPVDSEEQQPDLHSQMEARLKLDKNVQARGVF